MTLLDAPLGDVATPLALAALVVMQCFSLLKAKQGKGANGTMKSSVEPRDALAFWELQTGIDRKTDDIIKRLERVEVLLRRRS